MYPKETDRLVSSSNGREIALQFSFSNEPDIDDSKTSLLERWGIQIHNNILMVGIVLSVMASAVAVGSVISSHSLTPAKNNIQTLQNRARTGPYQLTELQKGHAFTSFYDFYEGADSVGSAGYNTYISYERAIMLGLVNVTVEEEGGGDDDDKTEVLYIQSLPTKEGPRESIRLEGKRQYDSGLFLLDLDHMPTGCGQWPAFWLTDEDAWPDNGEIDIVEGVNYQPFAKTALHTSSLCSMYAHVPAYKTTGHWDRATGIPERFTGDMDFNTSLPADNCWTQTPHQWANQGCVAVSGQTNTLGAGLNDQGGGVYALQWDPENRYIRSWVFPKALGIPTNLQDSMDTVAADNPVTPDPETWGLPYGYFAIGETTGCSANHFKNMRIVLNTAFCGSVAGNRFFTDCPKQAAQFNIKGDPVASCNAWIASDPDEMAEAYWKIRGVYVYERSLEALAEAGGTITDEPIR